MTNSNPTSSTGLDTPQDHTAKVSKKDTLISGAFRTSIHRAAGSRGVYVDSGGNAMDALTPCNDLSLTVSTTEPRVDTRLLARHLGNKHRHVMALLDRYVDELKLFGHVSFKNSHGERRQGGGKAERYALLNEDQAYFLLSLSRNTTNVVSLKVKLIKTFSEYRRSAELRRTEYLPSHQRLSEAIHRAAAGSPNEKFVHSNIARLLNKTLGIDSGQRKGAPASQQAFMIVLQDAATQILNAANDHHVGYQRVKQFTLAFADCMQLKVSHG